MKKPSGKGKLFQKFLLEKLLESKLIFFVLSDVKLLRWRQSRKLYYPQSINSNFISCIFFYCWDQALNNLYKMLFKPRWCVLNVLNQPTWTLLEQNNENILRCLYLLSSVRRSHISLWQNKSRRRNRWKKDGQTFYHLPKLFTTVM